MLNNAAGPNWTAEGDWKPEKEVWYTQKVESPGAYVSCFAHDFNRLLGIIRGYADLALEELSPDSAVRENILEIEKASCYAVDLCK